MAASSDRDAIHKYFEMGLAKAGEVTTLTGMEMNHQLRMYEVLSIRPSSKRGRSGGQTATDRANKPDALLSYFNWLCSAEIGPREKAWAKHACGRLA
jgi:hypothetical protein